MCGHGLTASSTGHLDRVRDAGHRPIAFADDLDGNYVTQKTAARM